MSDPGTHRLAARRVGSERARRKSLLRGLLLHVLVFGTATMVLFIANWMTRGPNGSWWVVWPLQIWAVVVGLHSLGVAVARTPGGRPRL